MSATPTVSVAIVSRGRPQALLRCLEGIAQLFHENFEVVVVADQAGCAALRAAGLSERLKSDRFDAANISAARNHAVAMAAGELIAFIDDDAVPEPTWLDKLTAPFSDETVVIAGGFVRGRNGISFQSTAAWVDQTGEESPIECDGAPLLLRGEPGRGPKVEGTNFAVRKATLEQVGGFDPAFRFYLDETDLVLRLAQQGQTTALVPQAEVHHGFLASSHRTASRMPTDLFDVGASKVIFLRKHSFFRDDLLDSFRAEQRARLVRHLVNGTAEPRDLGKVLATLEAGISEGARRPFGAEIAPGRAPEPFLNFRPKIRFSGSSVLAGRLKTPGLWRDAQALVRAGRRVSLFCLSPSSLYHRVSFESGVWCQSGGLFGRSERNQPLFKLHNFRARVAAETQRVASQRGLERADTK